MTFVAPDAIRSAFSAAMSAMYRAEVPLYGELIDIVAAVNADTLARDPGAAAGDTPARLAAERHGAIRVGTAAELAALARVFAVMGMAPVGYYDLAAAGVPVHSTAFRPVTAEALAASPFRVFTSLLRLELIEDEGLRAEAAAILARRRILSDRAMALVAQAEAAGGLTDAEADEFVAEVLETFRWRAAALVDLATYRRLSAAHRLIADVVCFAGPHINHLTPRTLDIDAAQAAMQRRGMAAKAVIEGPPRRAVPILLRQTSFRALDERIAFPGAERDEAGTHTARFGEIEQRGVALTPAGRALYDACLAEARVTGDAAAFARFPDDHATLRAQDLAWYRVVATPAGRAAAAAGGGCDGTVEDWIAAGRAVAEPVVYEDFLPVSAAGIFQSNLGGGEATGYGAAASQEAFEAALGLPVRDPFALYAQAAAASRAALVEQLGRR